MEHNNSDAQSKTTRKQREAVCISKQTLDKLLGHKDSDDMIALYLFYSYVAMWQGTNQPHATVKYVMKGLCWGKDKVRAVRSLLRDRGLIEDVADRDPVTNQVKEWYVRVAYFHPTCLPEGGLSQRVASKPPNAFRANKGNALRDNKEEDTPQRPHAASASAPAAPPLSLPVGFNELSEDEQEIVTCYNETLPPLGWLPVTRITEELKKAIAVPETECLALISGTASEPPSAWPDRRTLVRLCWHAY